METARFAGSQAAERLIMNALLRPKVGLLPLYLALYDQTDRTRRDKFQPFLDTIAGGFAEDGIDVVRGEICCVETEFRAAVARFEQEDVQLIVAVHLAYSPSLESAAALCETKIPLLFLDTTMDFDFGPTVDPSRIFYNHGIHGVQDLASVLHRRGRHYEFAVGHIDDPDLMPRACGIARAACAAWRFRTTKVLRIGGAFAGMGDFAVDDVLLEEKLGPKVTQIGIAELAPAVEAVSDADIAAEVEADAERFVIVLDEAVHRASVRVGLGLRRLLDEGGYTAFSMNFTAFDTPDGPVDRVPFLEASKAMARGMGYAGEGDVLTASLVGALNATYGDTTFTEIFCPDWKGNSLFLSHMGEVNPAIAKGKPRLIELDFPYTPAQNPAIPACTFMPGDATLVNLLYLNEAKREFGILAEEMEVLEEPENTTMGDCIRAWIRSPSLPLDQFLEFYSRCGGTHHSALMRGDYSDQVETMAEFLELG